MVRSSKNRIDESFVENPDSEMAIEGNCLQPMPWAQQLASSHGEGLRLACHRLKPLATTQSRAITRLEDTIQLLNTFGQALTKAAADKVDVDAAAAATNGTNHHHHFVAALPNTDQRAGLDLTLIRTIIIAQGVAYTQQSKKIQQNLLVPLRRYVDTVDEAVQAVEERYQQCETNQRRADTKLQMAHQACQSVNQEADEALTDWKKENTFDRALPSLISAKLIKVKKSQDRYQRMLDWHHECVRQAQRLEVMGLETMQKIAEERFAILSHALSKIVTTIDTSKQIHTNNDKEIADKAVASSPIDKRKPIILDLSNTCDFIPEEESSEIDGSGVMSCDILGLPLEVGEMRDKVQEEAYTRKSFLQAVKLLASLLNDVIAAVSSFEESINNQLHNNKAGSSIVSYSMISEEMAQADECECIQKLWNLLVRVLNRERAEALSLNRELKSLQTHKVNPVVSLGETTLIPAIERDDATWKQLCDAVRSQVKAEHQYIETTAQASRVRQRCKSVEFTASGKVATTNKQVSQSLVNMFAILPNGGEHAMKVLDASTRASIVQLSLDEANSKETRDRQILESTIAFLNLSLDAYKSNVAKTLTEFSKIDLQSYLQLDASVVLALDTYKGRQSDTSVLRKELLRHNTSVAMHASLDEWLVMIKDRLNFSAELSNSASGQFPPYQSEIVRQALTSFSKNLAADASREIDESWDDLTEAEELDDKSVTTQTPPVRERVGSASSADPFSLNSLNLEKNTSWLIRSLSMTEGESIFGKAMTKKTLPHVRQQTLDFLDTDFGVFATFFWPQNVDMKEVMSITDSFACSFRDGGQRYPFQYGRLFLSNPRLIFVSWTRKQFTLLWSEVLSVERKKKIVGSHGDSLIVKCRKGPSEESYMILSGLLDLSCTIEKIQERVNAVKQSSPDSQLLSGSSVTDFPPDQALSRMDVILSKSIAKTSVKQFYSLIWSEGDDTETQPFYKPWLEKENFDVVVGRWEFRNSSGPWCGESYHQTRIVKFSTKRTSYLYIGPPIANVTQTQFCRVEGDDKCVVMMTVEFEGIPCADCFVVHIRWVAIREHNQALRIEIGVSVDFKKNTFLKSKIQSGTLEETTIVHLKLFKDVTKVCEARNGTLTEHHSHIDSSNIETDEYERNSNFTNIFSLGKTYSLLFGVLPLVVYILLHFVRQGRKVAVKDVTSEALVEALLRLGSKIDSHEAELKAIREALRDILSLLRNKIEE